MFCRQPVFEKETFMEQLPLDLINQIIASDENRIKIFRQYFGLSSRLLAEKVHMSVEEIEQLENSRLDFLDLSLLNIAQSFKVDGKLLQEASCSFSNKDLRLLDFIFYKQGQNLNSALFKKQILNRASLVLYFNRKEWEENNKSAADILYSIQKRDEAINRAKCRDKKYAPFRKYFKALQQKKYLEQQQSGQPLSANGFARWFLENKDDHFEIPYAVQNQKNKLIQLAQANNRDFRKIFHHSCS